MTPQGSSAVGCQEGLELQHPQLLLYVLGSLCCCFSSWLGMQVCARARQGVQLPGGHTPCSPVSSLWCEQPPLPLVLWGAFVGEGLGKVL